MGTGVGEAALAAEAFGAAEAAGAVAGAGGMAEAGLLGGEYAGGLGLTGAMTGGLGNAALLGGEYAGGLGSLSPAFQTALGQTASVMPEVSAQVAQAVNPAAVPPVGAEFGWNPADLATAGQGAGDIAAGQASTPEALAQQFGSGIQNVNPGEFNELDAAQTADITKHITPEFMHSYLPTDTVNAADITKNATDAANWASMPTPTPTDVAQMADLAGPSSEASAWDAATAGQYGGPAGNVGGGSPWSGLKALTQPIQDWWNDQNKLTQYGLGGLGAMQAAKYLNKQPGVAAPAPYSGPLSKFRYDPSTYTPYTYKPYAAGGTVEQMSRENALGANTGYPQADINQGAYATPWQTPVSRNVVAGSGDANVDQMTGEERMADGGTADSGGAAQSDAAQAAPAIAASQQNFSDFLSRYQGAPEQAGLAALTSTERAIPAVMASRQNFTDFLARYQNMPVPQTAPAPAPTTYQGLTAANSAVDQAAAQAAQDQRDYPGYTPAQISVMKSWTPTSMQGLPTLAAGGMANLGGYSDGGRLLKGPGDGMSDNIPANISGRQPARLADGEFVVPADVVSGLGNGSTDAGAKQLYKMLDKVRAARTGTKKQGRQINADKYTPA